MCSNLRLPCNVNCCIKMSRFLRPQHFITFGTLHMNSLPKKGNALKLKFIVPFKCIITGRGYTSTQNFSRQLFWTFSNGRLQFRYQELQKTCKMSTSALHGDSEETSDANMGLAERFMNYVFAHANDNTLVEKAGLNTEEKQKLSHYRQLLPIAQDAQNILEEMKELKEIIQSQTIEKNVENELVEMAKHDLTTSLNSLKLILQNAATLLLPDHAFDEKSAVLEVQAGAGGNEASLFAEELFTLYVQYAREYFGVEITSVEKHHGGEGIDQATAIVKGLGAFRFLKYECGVHRVQRVPKASTGNKSDRLQTSTCSVAVLPLPDDAEYQVPEKELKIEFVKSSGPGGQNVNKLDTCCRITHIKSGVAVKCQEQRTQHQNKAIALQQVNQQ